MELRRNHHLLVPLSHRTGDAKSLVSEVWVLHAFLLREHVAIDDVGDGANDIPSIMGRMAAIIGPCAKAVTVIRHLVFKLVVTTRREAY